MTKSHNKKRNVGIVYEMLLQYAARSIVESKPEAVKNCFSIIKKHFKPGTELYREFRLFNALVKTTTSSGPVAGTIISEAKAQARMTDAGKLDYEKSLLIKSINHKINDKSFYRQRIPEYRMLATIQTLLNGWREPGKIDIPTIALFEHQVKDWLLKEKKKISLEELSSTDADNLVVKIMTEKLNNRYGQALNSEQKSIIRSYTLMSSDKDRETLVERLSGIKGRVLEDLDEYIETLSESNYLRKKAQSVREDIAKTNLDSIDDDTVSKFLTISQLKTELLEGEK